MLIYKITNKTNSKIYIGQTVRSLEERMQEHFKKSSNKTIIDKAIKKYGISNFDVEIVEIVNNIEELNIKEIEWIQKYCSIHPKGYNQCEGGGNTVGFKHREESKMKMSKSKKGKALGAENSFFGKKHSEEQKAKWSKERKIKARDENNTQFNLKPVKVINLDTLEVFNSVSEAGEKYGILSTHISRVCKGKRNRTGGFRWKYYKDYMAISCQALGKGKV